METGSLGICVSRSYHCFSFHLQEVSNIFGIHQTFFNGRKMNATCAAHICVFPSGCHVVSAYKPFHRFSFKLYIEVVR
jgi:hypothetical protein